MRFFRERRLDVLCLNTVVANLGNSSLRSILGEKYNNFLRKRYSDRIYNILRKTGSIDEDVVEWLISPFWNDIKVGKTHSISKLVPKFIVYGNKITSVSFENSSTSLEILSAVVCLLPLLKSLNLNGTSCSDDLLILIRKMCPELTSLSLFECNITDAGIKNLCYVNRKKVGFESLKILNIEKTGVNPHGIAYIFKNLNLEILKYPEVAPLLYYFYLSKLNKGADVSKIYELTELRYSSNTSLSTVSFQKILDVWVNVCPNVEKVNVADSLSESDFKLCLGFENLKVFKFAELPNSENPPNEGLAYFLENRGANLTQLVLQSVSVSVEVIARTCPNLQKLALNNIKCQDTDETVLSDQVYNLNSLTKLSIKNLCLYEKSTNTSVNMLISISKNLESVSFHCVRNLSEALVDKIMNMQHLLKAKFVFTDIKDVAAMKLFTCKNILRLYFDGCPYVSVEKCANVYCSEVRGNALNTFSWQIEYDESIT